MGESAVKFHVIVRFVISKQRPLTAAETKAITLQRLKGDAGGETFPKGLRAPQLLQQRLPEKGKPVCSSRPGANRPRGGTKVVDI